MSLCPLIYNNKQGINSANHLVSIMNIWNQLYSILAQLTRQSFLMQTELPTLLNVFETDYKLQNSESYTASRQKYTQVELFMTSNYEIAWRQWQSQYGSPLKITPDVRYWKPEFTQQCVLLANVIDWKCTQPLHLYNRALWRRTVITWAQIKCLNLVYLGDPYHESLWGPLI